jgi:hypothetical protein
MSNYVAILIAAAITLVLFLIIYRWTKKVTGWIWLGIFMISYPSVSELLNADSMVWAIVGIASLFIGILLVVKGVFQRIPAKSEG